MLIDIKHDPQRGRIIILKEPDGLLVQWNGKKIVVPKNFESDGASVPRFFWRWVFPPNDERALKAAIAHDFIYRNHPAGWTKSEADKMFYDLLIAEGMPKRYARRAYYGVKFFGGSAWKAGGK